MPAGPSRLLAAVAAAVLLAGCAGTVAGTPVSVFSDPFKVGGLEAVDGPTGLRPDAKPESATARAMAGTR